MAIPPVLQEAGKIMWKLRAVVSAEKADWKKVILLWIWVKEVMDEVSLSW